MRDDTYVTYLPLGVCILHCRAGWRHSSENNDEAVHTSGTLSVIPSVARQIKDSTTLWVRLRGAAVYSRFISAVEESMPRGPGSHQTKAVSQTSAHCTSR